MVDGSRGDSADRDADADRPPDANRHADDDQYPGGGYRAPRSTGSGSTSSGATSSGSTSSGATSSGSTSSGATSSGSTSSGANAGTDLLAAARAGDEAAIAELFRQIHPGLLLYVRRRAPDVAEDLVAETWMAAADGFASVTGDVGDFRAWLFTVARRRIADHYRRRGRRLHTVPLDVGGDTGDVDPDVGRAVVRAAGLMPDVAEGVVDALASEEALARLVRDLPGDQAEVVLLRVVAGLSSEQVATVLGRSVGSVRVMQHRALRRLQRTWATEGVTP